MENTLIVVSETSTYSNNPDLLHPNIHNHQHEEPDTQIPMHMLDASKTDGDIRDIDIYSPDTDTFVLLVDLVASNKIEGHFITAKE